MLLVHGLAGDAEGLGDLGPAPAGPDGLLDGRVLEAVGQPAQRDDRGEPVSRVTGLLNLDLRHVSNLS